MSQTVRTNLATNPTAASTTGEAAVPGTGGTAALTNQTTTGYSGSNYNRVTWTVATTALSGGIDYTVTGLAASTQYALSRWVRSSKAQTVIPVAVFKNGSGATVNTVTGTAVNLTANVWTQVGVVGTSGAAVTQAVLDIQATTGGALWANGDTLDGDAILAEAAATVGTYFDGSLTNAASTMYAWTGTANASASTATTYTPAIALTAKTDANPCPRVEVTLSDFTPTDNTTTLWRSADGVRQAVRGARRFTVNGSTFLVDYEAPLGRTLTYTLETTAGLNTGAPTTAATATVTSSTWWIQDPLVPSSAIPLATARNGGTTSLTAAAVKALEYDAAVTIIPVAGSAQPVAIGGQRLAAANIPFPVFTNAAQQATQLRSLLAQTAVLLIRPPGTGREAGVPGLAYTAAPKAAEHPITVAFGGTLTAWELTGSLVAAPTMQVLVPVWTYGNVAALWSTYQQAQTALAAKTYLDVLKSPSGA